VLWVIEDMHAHVSLWQSHDKQYGPDRMTDCLLIDIIDLRALLARLPGQTQRQQLARAHAGVASNLAV